jgi:hypothetical protein
MADLARHQVKLGKSKSSIRRQRRGTVYLRMRF